MKMRYLRKRTTPYYIRPSIQISIDIRVPVKLSIFKSIAIEDFYVKIKWNGWTISNESKATSEKLA